MDTARTTIRTQYLALIQESVDLRNQINALRWKPGTQEVVKALRSERQDGKRLKGKKALKPYRQPETGQERYALKYQKRWKGADIREWGLMYGLLRGMDYKRIEPKCLEGNEPSAWSLAQNFKKLGVGITEADIKAWFKGGPAPARQEQAA